MDDYLAANRSLWDAWTDLHVPSETYDLDAFRAGRDPLEPEELAEIGDVGGRSLLHLQCHFGKETLAWARHGAVVTGVDFSSRAIAVARELAAELDLPATFVCSAIDDLPAHLDSRFDVVYTSRGVLGWLPDLTRWAQVVAHFLAPDGTFYVEDIHPLLEVFDEDAEPPRLVPRYPYFHQREPQRFAYQGSYAAPDAPLQSVEYAWMHDLGEIVGALLGAGLRVVSLREHEHLAWKFFPWMVPADDVGRFRLPEGTPRLPLSFSLRAVKDAD